MKSAVTSVMDEEIAKKERRIKEILGDVNLSERQRETLDKYNRYMVQKGNAIGSRAYYLRHIQLTGITLDKPFGHITKQDIEDLIYNLVEKGYRYDRPLGKGACSREFKGKYSEGTIKLLKIVLKEFFTNFLKKPEVVEDLRTNGRSKTKLPEDMLSKEDILKLIAVTENFRDKAMVFGLYESATRCQEWMTLQIKHVKFDEYGATVIVNGKTGQRRIRLIESVPDLSNWINNHPERENPESPLWVNTGAYIGQGMSFNGMRNILTMLSKKSGLNRNIHPHLLRHSRITSLASEGFTEMELRIFAGWSSSSRMPETYIHLSGANIEDKMLRKAGVIKDKFRENVLQPRKCVRCENMNSPSLKYCQKCQTPLDVKTVLEAEKKREETEDEIRSFIKLVKDSISPEQFGELMKKAVEKG